MSDDICKHGWSRRFCEQCSQARIIASLKGPGDKGMLANPPDDLVERVGRELARTGYAFAGIDLTDPYTADADYWNSQARAAIAVCMEEAAKVAENSTEPNPFPTRQGAIAAAIRALVKHD